MSVSPTEWQGRVAFITGGANGIGRATAVLLAERGVRVFSADINPLQENDELFTQHSITAVECDVRHEVNLQSAIDAVVDQTGRLDLVVNNAGIGMVKQIGDVTEDDWSNCIDTNLKAAFFGCKHAIRHMQRAGSGAIVNTASNAGLLPRAHDSGFIRSARWHWSDSRRAWLSAIPPTEFASTRCVPDPLEKRV